MTWSSCLRVDYEQVKHMLHFGILSPWLVAFISLKFCFTRLYRCLCINVWISVCMYVYLYVSIIGLFVLFLSFFLFYFTPFVKMFMQILVYCWYCLILVTFVVVGGSVWLYCLYCYCKQIVILFKYFTYTNTQCLNNV